LRPAIALTTRTAALVAQRITGDADIDHHVVGRAHRMLQHWIRPFVDVIVKTASAQGRQDCAAAEALSNATTASSKLQQPRPKRTA